MTISGNLVTKFTKIIEIGISPLYTESVSKSGVPKSISKNILLMLFSYPD